MEENEKISEDYIEGEFRTQNSSRDNQNNKIEQMNPTFHNF
jgi:hypothetical protein